MKTVGTFFAITSPDCTLEDAKIDSAPLRTFTFFLTWTQDGRSVFP